MGGGATFIGDKGRITIFRDGYECDPVGLDEDPLPADAKRVYESDNHMQNFYDCVASRKDPIMTVEAGHSVATLCHLGNIARRLGRRTEVGPGEGDLPRRRRGQPVSRRAETQGLRTAQRGLIRTAVRGSPDPALRQPLDLRTRETCGRKIRRGQETWAEPVLR